MSQSILTNTLIAIVGRATNVVLGLVVIKLITNALGTADYGLYVLLFSVGTIVQLVADFGLYLTLTREIAERPGEEQAVIDHIVSLRLVLLMGAFLIGAGLALLFPPLRPLLTPFAIIAVGFSFQSVSQLLMGVFQFHQAVWRATIGDLVGRGLQIISIIVLSVHSISLTATVAAFTLGTGASLIVHQWLSPTARPRFRITWSVWQQLLKTSWPLGAMLVVSAVYFRIDTVMLSYFRPASEVGWYGLAYKIIESALFIPAMFGGLLLPRISEALSLGQRSLARRYLEEGLQFLVLIAAFAVVTTVMHSEGIIQLIADPSFLPAAPLLILLSPTLGILFLGNLFGFAMVALKKQRTLLLLYSILAVGNIGANFIAIPIWGAPAAAWTTLGTESIAAASAAWLVWRSIHFRLPWHYLLHVGLATSATIFAYQLVLDVWPTLISILVGALVFLTMALFTKAITRQQLSLLWR